MTSGTLAVHLDETADLTRLAPLAARLAHALKERLLCVATATVKTPLTGASLTLHLLKEQERDLTALLARMASRVRGLAKDVTVDWRSAITDDPTGYLLEQAVHADLILAEHQPRRTAALSRVDLGRLVLSAGRPVMVLPPHLDGLDIDRVIIGYKPVREGRAALQAALPILKPARHVLIAGVGEEVTPADLAEASGYLRGHGVEAEVRHRESLDDGVAATLMSMAQADRCGLIVSGAYGRGRAREMLFGGVTRDLLSGAHVPCLLVH